jgi:hypothetical protein
VALAMTWQRGVEMAEVKHERAGDSMIRLTVSS